MQTRIKVVTLANGRKRYYPQYKGWFYWCAAVSEWDYRFTNNLTLAQRYIDDFLAAVEEKRGNKKISTEYIKYP